MAFYQGARIYNLFPRLLGPMSNWKDAISRAKTLGFNWVYINPFHYPGFSGSIYSPKDFFEFNPLFLDPESELSGMDQLKEVIEYAKSLQVNLMMDLLINHTAIDHPLIVEHRDWYKSDDKGDLVRPTVLDEGETVVWGDLAEIDNEDSPDRANLWNYWWDLADFYMAMGFDGFRCDAAYKVTEHIWRFLISRSKEKYPHSQYFAETLGCELDDIVRLAKVGFDYTFNSSKWWNYEDSWCLKQYRETEKYAKSVSFPETHDTLRLAAELNGNMDQIKQRYLFSAIFSAGVMIPIGFEYGFKKPLNVVETMPSDWEPHLFDLSEYITRVNLLKSSFKIFNEDNEITVIDIGNPNVFAFLKISKGRLEKVLVLINKDPKHYQRIQVPSIYAIFDTHIPLVDISIEHRMDFIPDEFDYNLLPSQTKMFYYLYRKPEFYAAAN